MGRQVNMTTGLPHVGEEPDVISKRKHCLERDLPGTTWHCSLQWMLHVHSWLVKSMHQGDKVCLRKSFSPGIRYAEECGPSSKNKGFPALGQSLGEAERQSMERKAPSVTPPDTNRCHIWKAWHHLPRVRIFHPSFPPPTAHVLQSRTQNTQPERSEMQRDGENKGVHDLIF